MTDRVRKVVDNDPKNAARVKRAIRRLRRTSPNHTYDDVLDEADRLKEDEDENRTDV